MNGREYRVAVAAELGSHDVPYRFVTGRKHDRVYFPVAGKEQLVEWAKGR